MRCAGVQYSRLLLFRYFGDQPSTVPILAKIPFRIQLYQQRRGNDNGKIWVQSNREITQVNSFISLWNNPAPTFQKPGNVLSAGVNQLYWILLRKSSVRALFSVLAAPSAPCPHLCPSRVPQRGNYQGRTVREHDRSSRIQGSQHAEARPSNQLHRLITPPF